MSKKATKEPKALRNGDVVLEEIWRIKDTLSTVFSQTFGNKRRIAGIRWSACQICGSKRQTAMSEIKPSLRAFEAMLSAEEKVSA